MPVRQQQPDRGRGCFQVANLNCTNSYGGDVEFHTNYNQIRVTFCDQLINILSTLKELIKLIIYYPHHFSENISWLSLLFLNQSFFHDNDQVIAIVGPWCIGVIDCYGCGCC